ncbi:MAG: class I SAM-dependent methyltransferase [Nitrospinota bacterium]
MTLRIPHRGLSFDMDESAVGQDSVPCPVCGGRRAHDLFTDRNRRENLPIAGTYSSCVGCGAIYLRKRPLWEDIKALYDPLHYGPGDGGRGAEERGGSSRWKGLVHWTRKWRFRPHSWPLEPAGRHPRRLLDVGCGDGRKLEEFAARGWEVWGIDVSPNALRMAAARLPGGRFLAGELEGLDLPHGSFDVVRLDNVLEHVPRPVETLQICHRLLNPGGRLICLVPHGKSLSMRVLGRYSISAWVPFHLTLFTRGSLRRALEGAGFGRVALYDFCPLQWPAASLFQLLKSPGWGNQRIPRWWIWACYPFGCAAAWMRVGEELVAVATKEGT